VGVVDYDDVAAADDDNNNKMDHIISACLMLAKKQYIQRHDRVYAELYCTTCKRIAVTFDKQHWNQRVPKSFERIYDGKITMFWNQQVKTDRSVPNNKPDNIIRDHEKGACMLTDIALSGDGNVIR
jgi:hypothetical protein